MKFSIPLNPFLYSSLSCEYFTTCWGILRKSYRRTSFEDAYILLKSPLGFFNRKIYYEDILEIIIDHTSTTRIIETHEEYFLVNKISREDLEGIAKRKGIKLSIVNDMF